MSVIVRDPTQRRRFKNLNGGTVHDGILEMFIGLCFAEHPDAVFVKMIKKRDVGVVCGRNSRVLGRYRLACGDEGFHVMKIKIE